MTLSPVTPARLLACAALLALAALTACGQAATTSDESAPQTPAASPSAPDSNLADGCIESFDSTVDYFPDKASFDHATGVAVTYEDSYKVVEVTTLDREEPLRYVLLQCGAPEPSLDGALTEAQVVEVPARTVISLTTTNLPHFAEVGMADRVIGVGTGDFVATEEVRERIDAGEVDDYAGPEGQTNTEAVIGAQPDLLIMDAFGETIVEEAQRFADAGVPAVLNADFNEQELLGRAEWLKFTALFLNAEAQANEAFDDIAGSYDDIAAAAAASEERPTVFLNTPIEGTWFTPGGDSFLANALEDANAEYVFSDDESTYSLELDIETVLDRAAEADVWLQAGSVNGTLDDLLAIDERFDEFKAFRDGNVWAYDKWLTPGGGYAVFEVAYTRADHLLADLVKILHPEALPEHELIFFGRVPEADAG